MSKFFMIPFGASAPKSTIPDNDSVNVSWNTGYTLNYEYNPLTNKDAKHIERGIFNTLLYEITAALQEMQLYGISLYHEDVIKVTGPGYKQGSLVSYGGTVWRSKINNNKIIPNANSINNWEAVYGYNELVEKLIADKYVSDDPDFISGYTKTDIDDKIASVITDINETLKTYLLKRKGEIYFLSWVSEDRNDEGFFLCNGDELPYDPEGKFEKGDDPLTYYGNVLYSLCYTKNSSGVNVESEFFNRWRMKIDTNKNTIQLPNILGLKSDGTYASETGHMLLAMSRTPGIPRISSDVREAFTNDTTNNAYIFKMAPCIYLGIKPEEVS